jgi:sec-independent protein translocase protein TatB
MFGFDWPELIIIGIVALIFIGPEDLPQMFRQLGRFTAKLRQMSREFSRAMEQAAKDTGVSDVARDLKASTSMSSTGLDKVREAADKFEKWDPIKNAAKPTMTSAATMPARSLTPPPMPATPAPVASSLTSVAERDAVLSSIEDEMDDDLAAFAEDEAEAAADAKPVPAPMTLAPTPTIHGPATQALYEKQALRAKVLAEQAEKLKAIEAGTYLSEASPAALAPVPAPETAAPRKRTTKPKADTVKAAAAEEAKVAAPKTTSRKKKADNA